MTTADFLSRQAALNRRDMMAMAIYSAFVSVVAVIVLAAAWGFI